eukprot:6490677-Amphidinium_carterae.7
MCITRFMYDWAKYYHPLTCEEDASAVPAYLASYGYQASEHDIQLNDGNTHIMCLVNHAEEDQHQPRDIAHLFSVHQNLAGKGHTFYVMMCCLLLPDEQGTLVWRPLQKGQHPSTPKSLIEQRRSADFAHWPAIQIASAKDEPFQHQHVHIKSHGFGYYLED